MARSLAVYITGLVGTTMLCFMLHRNCPSANAYIPTMATQNVSPNGFLSQGVKEDIRKYFIYLLLLGS